MRPGFVRAQRESPCTQAARVGTKQPPHDSLAHLQGSAAGGPDPSPVSKHDLQQPRRYSATSFRLLPTSPARSVSKPGIRPGFLTMNDMSAEGSPPMLKNSRSFSVTKSLKFGCVATLTRWPYVSFSTLPNATKGSRSTFHHRYELYDRLRSRLRICSLRKTCGWMLDLLLTFSFRHSFPHSHSCRILASSCTS